MDIDPLPILDYYAHAFPVMFAVGIWTVLIVAGTLYIQKFALRLLGLIEKAKKD